MPKRWTKDEEEKYRKQLQRLYIDENLTFSEVAEELGMSETGVYDRLVRLGIDTCSEKKDVDRSHRRKDIRIPSDFNPEIAEFFGAMMGDGSVTPTQLTLTLGTKEKEYVDYLVRLMEDIFKVEPSVRVRDDKRINRSSEYRVIYLGSKDAVEWGLENGLVYNKVESQVPVPEWVFKEKEFKRRFVRGFFDTDGCIYELRYGAQVSFKNSSRELLKGIRKLLNDLDYSPSKISSQQVYLTRKNELVNFLEEIKPKNSKHKRRFNRFLD